MATVICRRAWVESFDLALTRPLAIGDLTLQSRQGCYLCIEDAEGRRAAGECAPLPGRHRETLADANAQLREVATACQGRALPLVASSLGRETLLPSVHFARDMVSQAWRWQQTPMSPKARCRITLNALLWAQDRDLNEEAERLISCGYRSLKVKVGRQSLRSDIDRLIRLKARVAGRALLRLDGNRAWSLEEALRFASAVGSEGIDYIEEPLQDPENHTRFWKQTGIRIALDESLAESSTTKPPVTEAIGALVIKPALLGPLDRTLCLIDWAREQHIDAVLSSVFESPLALHFYARLARREGLGGTPQGLDTWRWFVEHTNPGPFSIKDGSMTWTEDG